METVGSRRVLVACMAVFLTVLWAIPVCGVENGSRWYVPVAGPGMYDCGMEGVHAKNLFSVAGHLIAQPLCPYGLSVLGEAGELQSAVVNLRGSSNPPGDCQRFEGALGQLAGVGQAIAQYLPLQADHGRPAADSARTAPWPSPEHEFPYCYLRMTKQLHALAERCGGLLELFSFGRSLDGRQLWAAGLGHGNREILLNASHHAREHITTDLLMAMLVDYLQAYVDGRMVAGVCVRSLLDAVKIWFVPMVNPDGVSLVLEGAEAVSDPNSVIQLNGGSTDFRSWKANARGVDLNRQYPYLWELAWGSEEPGRSGYKGTEPLSEPEVAALVRFVQERNFLTAAAYHSSGSVIFTRLDSCCHRTHVAALASEATGYPLVDLTHASGSGAGFTDWFVHTLQRPALTVEVGTYVGARPVPMEQWPQIWHENRDLGLLLAQEAKVRDVEPDTGPAVNAEKKKSAEAASHLVIGDVRWGDHGDHERLVFDVYYSCYTRKAEAGGGFGLDHASYPPWAEVTFADAEVPKEIAEVDHNRSYLIEHVTAGGPDAYVLQFQRPVQIHAFSLQSPARIVLDLRPMDIANGRPLYSLRTQSFGSWIEALSVMESMDLGEGYRPRLLRDGAGGYLWELALLEELAAAERALEETPGLVRLFIERRFGHDLPGAMIP